MYSGQLVRNTCFISAVASPTITSLEQTDLTTVRVTWTPPQYHVTGYRVKHLLASQTGSSGIETLSAEATSTNITGLSNGGTYIVSVEAISKSSLIVSGASKMLIITLGMTFNSPVSLFFTHKALAPAVKYPPTFLIRSYYQAK